MKSIFRSFWMGGFEGADHVNSQGHALSMNDASAHWSRLAEDYAQLAQFGIRTVRESIGWRIFDEDPAAPDRLAQQARLAQRHGLQVIWTLHHYGVPRGIDFFSDDFAASFASFCERAARRVLPYTDGDPVFQPINEISFLSWAATATPVMHPYRPGSSARGHDLKCRLVRAALAGCDALWSLAPRARIVHTDPMINVVPADPSDPSHRELARRGHAAQYEAWDMLSGRAEPSLGGAPRYLDILGINYYHDNQWELPTHERLHWHHADPRRRDIVDMLADLHARYGRPQLIAETGHVGEGRADWITDIASAARRCERLGVPLEGVCLYPIVDRHDWEDPNHWHRCGLWDLPDAPASGRRVLHLPMADVLRRWNTRRRTPSSTQKTERAMPHLLVFSHLRWDFVYQRPQHLMSRLARHFDVIFLEEPVPNASSDRLERIDAGGNVRVLRPHLTGAAHGFHDEHIPALRRLLDAFIADESIRDPWHWFYTPMALPLAAGLDAVGTVYDCMDELSAFRNAPPQLLQRESALLKEADLVFTGGSSLDEAKRDRHPDVHCFPSSVDAAHFSRQGRALSANDEDPAAQAHPGRPRLGFFGVIDERIDLALVAGIADARPDWQLVMVGPVVKIDPASLPQRENIQWPGQRSYAELPDLVAGWDVCLLPFALNESTRFISPTKTLEYLAADRPAVSTPIRDVVAGYSGIVAIASDAEGFVAACQAALGMSAEARVAASAQRQAVVAGTSWDRTADAMAALMVGVQARKLAEPAPSAAGAERLRQAV